MMNRTGDPKPTLDYVAPKPQARAKKWAKRLALAALILTCVYAAPLAWLYVGWKQEQPARQMVARVGGTINKAEPTGPAFLGQILPARLGWIRERITTIALVRTSASDHDLRTLGSLRRLNVLWLSDTRVTDDGLVQLKGLTGLRYLGLEYSAVTDGGLVHLKGLAGLQELYLRGTRVTDGGLVHLKGFTELQVLDLSRTRVTDGGLVQLKGFTQLQQLYLIGTWATGTGVAGLRKALPQCSILY